VRPGQSGVLEVGAAMSDGWIVAGPRSGAINALAASREEWTADPEPWMERALCAQVGSEMFFPDKGGSTRDAKRVCANCDVEAQCLAYALRNDERFGIWGGRSERERRALRPHLSEFEALAAAESIALAKAEAGE
jgi:WhiB family transcriptional regulator, redox-sensing transcriptional regulator